VILKIKRLRVETGWLKIRAPFRIQLNGNAKVRIAQLPTNQGVVGSNPAGRARIPVTNQALVGLPPRAPYFRYPAPGEFRVTFFGGAQSGLVDQAFAAEEPKYLAFLTRHHQRLATSHRSTRFALDQRQRVRLAQVVGGDEFHRLQQLA
jgi:hypothetical protein